MAEDLLPDVTKKQTRLLQRRALNEELGRNTTKFDRRLGNTGLSAEDINALAGTGNFLAEDALLRMSGNGAISGRRASVLQSRLTRERGISDLDEYAEISKTRAQDDIALQAGGLQQQLAAILGPGVDPNSAALMQVAAGNVQRRQDATLRALESIDQSRISGQMALRQNADANIVPLLTDIGDTVAALEALRDQENAQRDAFRGQMFGTLLGPAGGLIGGGLTGGTRGAAQGVASGMDTVALVLKALGVGGFGVK